MSVCLIVIYNHNFEKNIEKIRHLYGSRFPHMVQIMPFYRGNAPDVVGVYDAAWQFNAYIAHAWDRIKAMGEFSHYFVISDDMIINPELNADNLIERMGLPPGAAYTVASNPVDTEKFFVSPWIFPSYTQLMVKGNNCEFERFIPTIEEARKHCERHGVDWHVFAPQTYMTSFLPQDIPLRQEVLGTVIPQSWRGAEAMCRKIVTLGCSLAAAGVWSMLHFRRISQNGFRRIVMFFSRFFAKGGSRSEPLYPLFFGYSDIFIIPSEKMEDFVHMGGVLAAARVFVEASIPTALMFTMDKVLTSKDVPYKDKQLWFGDRTQFVKDYHASLAYLYENFPQDVLFYHPVKLSEWQFDI